MFQMVSPIFKFSAMDSASMVLPVPGSPLISKGFCRAMAILTLRINSSDAI